MLSGVFSKVGLPLGTKVYSRQYSLPASSVVIASIGNPSPQYDGTRHSVGHWVLDEVKEKYWKDFSRFSGASGVEIATSETNPNVLLAKSIKSYMNLQGKPISKFWQKHKKDARLVIVHDELQIPLGKVQIRRRNTSARGHNGLRSIDNSMGNDYTKIAIGIGKPAAKHDLVSDYVLSKFTKNEMDVLREVTIPRVAQILEEMSQGKHINERYEK